MVNAVSPLGRARCRRNQGKVDEARRNFKRRLDDELNSYQTCTRIILVLVHIAGTFVNCYFYVYDPDLFYVIQRFCSAWGVSDITL